MKKRLLAVMLVLFLMIGCCPISSSAWTTASGTCGDNLRWNLENQVLTISGTGDMYNYDGYSADWQICRDEIVNIVIESGVTSIGQSAFYGLPNVIDIVIPDSITWIGYEAFQMCQSLQTIHIPQDAKIDFGSITKLCSVPFCGCRKLDKIIVDESNPYYTSIDGVLYDKGVQTLLRVPEGKMGELRVPEGVKTIADNAFDQHRAGNKEDFDYILNKIYVPSTVNSLPCTGKLTDGSWPIRAGEIEVDANNSTYCTKDGLLLSKDETILFQCSNGKIGTVEIPDTVLKICNNAFEFCFDVSGLRIPKNAVFYNRDDIFASLTEVYGLSFFNLLEQVEVEDGHPQLSTMEGNVYTPDKSQLLFFMNRNMKDFSIPKAVKKIGLDVFTHTNGNNYALTDIYYHGTAEEFRALFDVKDNEWYTFDPLEGTSIILHCNSDEPTPSPTPSTTPSPTPIPTASSTPSPGIESIPGNAEDLLYLVTNINQWYREFDSSKAVYDGDSSVLDSLVVCHPGLKPDVLALYPGEDEQFIKGSDPLGRWPQGISCKKIDVNRTDGILHDIYNISEESINSMKQKINSTDNQYGIYEFAGFYYASTSRYAFGSGPLSFGLQRIERNGNLYLVVSNITLDWGVKNKAYSIVEPKKLYGHTFWTIHYNVCVEKGILPELPPQYGFTVTEEIDNEGLMGENISWKLSQDGTLTISGTGNMFSWGFYTYPFSPSIVQKIILEDGITNIGAWFLPLTVATSIRIPNSVKNVDVNAFKNITTTDIYYDGTQEQWNQIDFGGQDLSISLPNTTIHYTDSEPGTKPTPTSTPTPIPTSSPSPTVPVTTTDTSADGTVTTTTTWPDGKTSVDVKSPNGDKKLTVTNGQNEKLAEISIPSNPGPGKSFTDVSDNAWYKDDVAAATSLGLFAGTSSNQFSPDSPMTRGMLATVLYNLSGNVEYGLGTGKFSDVSGKAWYKDSVDWAQATGVVAGIGGGKYGPDNNITREQLVTMLYRYADFIGKADDKRTNISKFADSTKVSRYAQDAMEWAVAEGFVSGVGNNRLDPKGNATRAQVAAILTRFVKYLNK